QFEDITEKAVVAGTRQWSTGVAMADVNGDGWLDIYVCNSGDVEGDNRENELFINQGGSGESGIPIFKEQAKEYGLADPGLSTHAAFFDYDKDGDLDMYLLNNSFRSIGSFDLRKNERNKRDPLGGHKLFRNDAAPSHQSPVTNHHFTDVSEQAGIYGSIIGFGLGVTVGDVDKDGWQDIYVSNDFFERDYLYVNNQDGTFREVLPESMGSISAASMGADLADINNDALPDLFVTEMLPETEARLKMKTTFDSWNRYREAEGSGYHHQFTRNMLQLNLGVVHHPSSLTPHPSFAEVGRFAKVEATDWSWGALIQDYNNDGWKDIFVANGIYQDLTDQDFLQFVASDEVKKSIISREGVDFKKLVDLIPSEPVPNYCFMGQGDLKFVNQAKEWGVAKPGFSNGSAYGDLDNDGDLDLVVNNLNSPASIFRNNGEKLMPQNHWLSVTLKGEGGNTFAVGAKLTARVKGKTFYLEHNPIRGFESSMDYRQHFGLGDAQMVDTLLVEWYYGKATLMTNVPTNQFLTLNEKDAQAPPPTPKGESDAARPLPSNLLLQDVTASVKLDFKHHENLFVDFDRDRLVYHMISTESPKMAVGDVNGDGRDDFFIGNAKDSPGALFVQAAGGGSGGAGGFSKTNQAIFEADKDSEDSGSAFFDADGDGDLDLYVASGGNEFSSSSSALASRLYLNDGRGNFSKSNQLLPAGKFESTSCVVPADFDGDGDNDLFVGVRLIPFYYGVPGNGYLLQNDG
ncbi:MAG: VCBS repeat-containing protein, partial [Bacteroidota bacterium]